MNVPTAQQDDRLNFKRAAMVLFALEQSLGSYVREKVNEISDLPEKQTQKFIAKNITSVEGLIQETYVSEILDLAIAAASQASDAVHLKKLKELSDSLEIYEIRNAIAHPNRPFADCYWFRLAAIATDPVIDILSFNEVKHAFESALANKISLPPEEWFSVFAFALPNNLPKTTEHEITGLIGRDREKAELLKKLCNKRFPLVALVGPGGTGKTAIALDVLRDASLDPKTYEWADELVYVTAKTERLTKDGPIPLDNPIASIEDVKHSITEILRRSNELPELSFEDIATNLASRKVLICLDNLETLLRDHPGAFDDFYSCLPADSNWRFLLTSRVPVDAATTQSINPMQVPTAGILARNYLQRRGGAPVSNETITGLVEKTECNPLAIRICIDGIVAGSDIADSLAKARGNILEFSYTNLIKRLPLVSNKVLECLFAANQKLTRDTMCFLLDTDSDQIAIGVQSLLRTSLVTRHSEQSIELYSLSSSIRDLLLRYPLDDATRSSVFGRLAEQQHVISTIQAQDRVDPLDKDYISPEISEEVAHQTYRAFQLVRRREAKAMLADHLESIRNLLVQHREPALFRAAALLLLELNDRDSARRMLETARESNALDSSGRLMLAELYKNESRLEECYETSRPLRTEEWFSLDKTDRTNMTRLSRVTWLVGVWLGKALYEIQEVSDWARNPVTRAIKGSIYVTAVRRLLEVERSKAKVNEYAKEMFRTLSEIFRLDGYVGFVVAEAAKAIQEFLRKIDATSGDRALLDELLSFADSHLVPICNTHSSLNGDDEIVINFIERIESMSLHHGVATSPNLSFGSKDDPALSEYGYIPVQIYHTPVDEFGHFRSYLFAEDEDGIQYHISKRSVAETFDFSSLKVGDTLMVLPRDDYDEGKARPVRDVIPVWCKN